MTNNDNNFEEKSLNNHYKSCFFTKVTATQFKKKGREAGHGSPNWGCTKTQVFNENI